MKTEKTPKHTDDYMAIQVMSSSWERIPMVKGKNSNRIVQLLA